MKLHFPHSLTQSFLCFFVEKCDIKSHEAQILNLRPAADFKMKWFFNFIYCSPSYYSRKITEGNKLLIYSTCDNLNIIFVFFYNRRFSGKSKWKQTISEEQLFLIYTFIRSFNFQLISHEFYFILVNCFRIENDFCWFHIRAALIEMKGISTIVKNYAENQFASANNFFVVVAKVLLYKFYTSTFFIWQLAYVFGVVLLLGFFLFRDLYYK